MAPADQVGGNCETAVDGFVDVETFDLGVAGLAEVQSDQLGRLFSKLMKGASYKAWADRFEDIQSAWPHSKALLQELAAGRFSSSDTVRKVCKLFEIWHGLHHRDITEITSRIRLIAGDQPMFPFRPEVARAAARVSRRSSMWLYDQIKDGSPLRSEFDALVATEKAQQTEPPHAAIDTLRGIYQFGRDAQLYSATFFDHKQYSSVVTKPTWVGLRAPMAVVGDGFSDNVVWVDVPDSLAALHLDDPHCTLRTRLPPQVARTCAEIAARGTRLTERPQFRLLSWTPNRQGTVVSYQFGECSFSEAQFTSGMVIGDELRYALRTVDGDVDQLRDDFRSVEPKLLPLRQRFFPDSASFFQFRDRLCIGGVQCMTVIARENDWGVPFSRRSATVTEGRRLKTPMPKGYHETRGDILTTETARYTADPADSVWREFYEELFSGVEVEDYEPIPTSAWDYIREDAALPLRDLMHSPGQRPKVHVEVVGLGVNMLQGNYEIAVLIIVLDKQWYRKYHATAEGTYDKRSPSKIKFSWEAEDRQEILAVTSDPDPRDPRECSLQSILTSPDLVAETVFVLGEGLRRFNDVVRDYRAAGFDLPPALAGPSIRPHALRS